MIPAAVRPAACDCNSRAAGHSFDAAQEGSALDPQEMTEIGRGMNCEV
jgi:hypothetical protein